MENSAAGMTDKPTVTRQQLRDALGRLGIGPGDVILVHSSLSSLGHMDGGADGVIDALAAAVGPAGHVMVPTHSYCYLNSTGKGTPYDPASSPSRTGLITEVFRQRPGAIRSGHPTHSVTAIGPSAELLMSGHAPGGGTFNVNGPHGRYVRWGAKIVFLGVGLSANTTYHAVEEWLELPYMPDARVLLAGPGGAIETVTVNRPSGHRNFYRNQGLNIPDTVTDSLWSAGLIRREMLNDTRLLMVHSRDVIRVTTQCELASPGALLCSEDSCGFCELGRHHILRQRGRIAAAGGQLLARRELCDPSAPADRAK